MISTTTEINRTSTTNLIMLVASHIMTIIKGTDKMDMIPDIRAIITKTTRADLTIMNRSVGREAVTIASNINIPDTIKKVRTTMGKKMVWIIANKRSSKLLMSCTQGKAIAASRILKIAASSMRSYRLHQDQFRNLIRKQKRNCCRIRILRRSTF